MTESHAGEVVVFSCFKKLWLRVVRVCTLLTLFMKRIWLFPTIFHTQVVWSVRRQDLKSWNRLFLMIIQRGKISHYVEGSSPSLWLWGCSLSSLRTLFLRSSRVSSTEAMWNRFLATWTCRVLFVLNVLRSIIYDCALNSPAPGSRSCKQIRTFIGLLPAV